MSWGADQNDDSTAWGKPTQRLMDNEGDHHSKHPADNTDVSTAPLSPNKDGEGWGGGGGDEEPAQEDQAGGAWGGGGDDSGGDGGFGEAEAGDGGFGNGDGGDGGFGDDQGNADGGEEDGEQDKEQAFKKTMEDFTEREIQAQSDELKEKLISGCAIMWFNHKKKKKRLKKMGVLIPPQPKTSDQENEEDDDDEDDGFDFHEDKRKRKKPKKIVRSELYKPINDRIKALLDRGVFDDIHTKSKDEDVKFEIARIYKHAAGNENFEGREFLTFDEDKLDIVNRELDREGKKLEIGEAQKESHENNPYAQGDEPDGYLGDDNAGDDGGFGDGGDDAGGWGGGGDDNQGGGFGDGGDADAGFGDGGDDGGFGDGGDGFGGGDDNNEGGDAEEDREKKIENMMFRKCGYVLIEEREWIEVLIKGRYALDEYNNKDYRGWSVQPSEFVLKDMQRNTNRAMKCFDNLGEEIRNKIVGLTPIEVTDYEEQDLPKYDHIEVYKNLNIEQKKAVLTSLDNNFTLIQGPPGTGKTTTAIAILTILAETESRILVAAQSNKAVDNIAVRLYKSKKQNYDTTEVARLNSKISEMRERMIYDDNLRNISFDRLEARPNWDKEKCKFFCVTLGSIPNLAKGFDIKDDFETILVDEATQATEVDLIRALRRETKRIILIGDQKQLGPVFQSQENKDSLSMFSRLVDEPENSFVMLKEQYRMHPSICKDSNNIFYEEKLRNGIKAADRDLASKALSELFIKAVREEGQIEEEGEEQDHCGIHPKLFLDLPHGEEKKVGKSTANPVEAYTIKAIMEKIKSSIGAIRKKHRDMEYDDKEIPEEEQLPKAITLGIICNYSAQVRMITDLLGNLDAYKREGIFVRISTVDAFQGEEQDFILISNVRANDEGAVGFLCDTRRMNVALTRARHGMIVLGRSDTLTQGIPEFGQLIEAFQADNCFVTLEELGLVVEIPEEDGGDEEGGDGDGNSRGRRRGRRRDRDGDDDGNGGGGDDDY